MASTSEPVTFREFCPLYYLLNAIPTKIQKGFRSLVVYLTALDVNGDYIAVGSSIGMLYLYCRRVNQMRKYNFEGRMESITVVKLLSCFDDLVAAGTASGRVAIFQLVSSLPGRNKQLRRFDVAAIHKTSITALAWSPNGMKLFSGDDKGKIVYSSLNLDQGICTSHLVLEEPSSIVQLDYSQRVLLVSTYQRSLLFYTEERAVQQVGTQPRKSTGKFGACFIPGLCKQSNLTLYASRPGLRLWKADVHGTVQATFILKDMFAGGMRPFELYPRLEPADGGGCGSSEKHLGLVSCFSRDGWVLSWNEYSIYLLDTANQATIAGLEGSGDIVCVSCTENEIFFLKGDRNIIRLSTTPEGPASIVRDNLEVAGSAECVLAQWGEKPMGASGAETRLRGSSVTSFAASEPRSRSSSLNSTDSSSGLPGTPAKGNQAGPQRFSVISSEDFDQELVVKPLKVKKRRRRRKSGGSRSTCPSSLDSTPCCELPMTSPQALLVDLLPTPSSLGSISLESPDCESSLPAEASSHGLQDLDLEELGVLEVPEPSLDLLDENHDPGTDVPPWHLGPDEELHSREQSTPLPPREDGEGCEVPGLHEEFGPMGNGQHSRLSPCPEQDSTELAPEATCLEPGDPQTVPDAPSLGSSVVPYSLGWAPCADQWPLATRTDEDTEDAGQEQDCLGTQPWPTEPVRAMEGMGAQQAPLVSPWPARAAELLPHPLSREPALTSSDDEDIYAHGLPSSSSETSMAELRGGLSPGQDSSQPGPDDGGLLKTDQFAESWMGYSGPGYGILSLAVSEKRVWCLDYKGGLFCSALPAAGLRWQKFEDGVQQVAVSPSGWSHFHPPWFTPELRVLGLDGLPCCVNCLL